MKICFIDVLGLTYDGSTLDKKGLGGSESAIILLTKQLARLGFSVTVFNDCFSDDSKPGVYDSVVYKPLHEIENDYQWDCVISSRSVAPFCQKGQVPLRHDYQNCNFEPMQLNSKFKVYWMHDTFSDGDLLVEQLVCEGKINEIFTLTDWHTSYVTNCDHGKRRNFDILKNHIFQTRNGIGNMNPSWVDVKNKDPDLFVFNASVTKGMVPLCNDIWPEVKKRIPSAKLKVIGGYYRFRTAHGPDQQELDWRKMVDDHPEIDFLGVIPQQEISKILAEATFMIYPTAFPETFSISALEALAHNCPIITCRFGALEETALDLACYKLNYTIEPNWSVPWLSKPDQVKKFCDLVEYAYNTKYLLQQKQYACNQIKEICGWDGVALQWKQHLYKKTGRFLPIEEYRQVQKINHKVRKTFGRRFYNLEELEEVKQKQQSIVIITPVYNSQNYIENCIKSVLQQDYDNYCHYIIDDCSTDNTVEIIEKNLHSKLKLIKNQQNNGAVYNQVHTIKQYCKPNDIVMLLDGDDWLVNDPQIFNKYNNLYHDDAEFTYGSCWSLVDNIPLIAQPYPPEIKQKKAYRQYKFNWNMPYTHLRTFRAMYLQKNDNTVFMDSNGNWMKAGGDTAVFYNTIEQVEPDNVVCCPDVVYNYNDTNPINDYKVNAREQTMNANNVLNNVLEDKKFSFIMPTMWRCWELTEKVLAKLQSHPLVDEIIIINNDVERTPAVEWHPKIKMLNQAANIRVNPAWNLGVQHSRNDLLCIINDDIDFDTHLLNRIRPKLTPNSGAYGLITGEAHFNHPETTDYSIDFIKWKPGDNIHCFGQLMLMHKANWVPIIDGLDIYFGDDFIFHNHLKRGLDNYLIYNIQFYSPMSQTCKDLSISGGFYDREKPIWEKYFLENPIQMMIDHHNDPIVQIYNNEVNTPSDINQHLPKLLEIAKQCDSITELGVRTGKSTTAFLASGVKLTSYDIEETPEARHLFNLAQSTGKNCRYIADPVQGNSLSIDIEQTDLLFIDTIHSYDQLSKELERHHTKVNKFICFHDTHIFGYEFQPHLDMPVYQHFMNQGLHQKGLLHAIIDFLIKHPEWKFKHHSVYNNGLTVLQRHETATGGVSIPVIEQSNQWNPAPKKILVAIPTARYIEPETFKAIYDLECPPGYEVQFQYFYGYNVDQVRNLIASWVCNGFDYLFAVDHDIVFKPDTLVKMLSHDKPIVTGIYRQRLPNQMIEVYDRNFRRLEYDQLPDNQLIDIGGCGMGCCLIKKEVFVSIGYPQYVYHSALDHNHTFSEDLDFCRKAIEKGFNLYCDTSIVCDHYGQTVYKVEKQQHKTNSRNEVQQRLLELSEMDLLPQETKRYLWDLKGKGFEPKVIYDIGSSVLHWAKFAQIVWPNARIVLFEAMEDVEFLYKMNGYSDYYLGVLSSYENNGKILDFYQNLQHPGGNSYYRENVQYSYTADLLFPPEQSKVKKLALTVDRVRQMKDFPEPDLIKIDCQGAELDILKGMEQVKAGVGYKDIILEAQNVEYNLGAPQKQTVFDFMQSCGYQMVQQITNGQIDNDYHFRLLK